MRESCLQSARGASAMCEQNRELCFYCVWYIVGTACGPGPVDDTTLSKTWRPVLCCKICSQVPAASHRCPAPLLEKRGSNNMWHLPSPIVAFVMKVVLILPFEVLHMPFGGKRRRYWMGKGKREGLKNNNVGWKMSPQWNPQHPAETQVVSSPLLFSTGLWKEGWLV